MKTAQSRTTSAAWEEANKEKRRLSKAAWHKANPESRRAANAAWQKANPQKKRILMIRWIRKHPEAIRQAQARRRAIKINQCCNCCTPAQIRLVYKTAPLGYDVDHKIPLARGGLHCCHNLQALTKAEHKAKTIIDWAAIRKLEETEL